MFLSKFFSNARAKVMMTLAGLTMVLGVGASISMAAAQSQNEVVETKAYGKDDTTWYVARSGHNWSKNDARDHLTYSEDVGNNWQFNSDQTIALAKDEQFNIVYSWNNGAGWNTFTPNLMTDQSSETVFEVPNGKDYAVAKRDIAVNFYFQIYGEGATWTGLYWSQPTYTVTLDKQSGSGGSASTTSTYGLAMPAISTPTRTGYTFQGYYSGTDGTGTKYYNANGTSARTWNLTANTRLYAYWSANEYTITVNLDGGFGVSNNSYTFKTTAQTVTLDTPTKAGKDFAGYTVTTQPTSGNVTVSSNTTLNIPANAYGNFAVTAQWSDGTYTITFNANGGDASAPSSMNPGVGVEVDLPNYTGTKTGYTFAGWNTATDGSGNHYDVGECTPVVAKGGTLALFAEWSINSHDVSATTGDGVSSVYFSTSSTATSGAGTSFDYGATVHVFAVKKAGWTAPNTWTLISDSKYHVTSHEMPDENYSFGTISATAASFDITYDTDGGAAISKGSYTMRGSNQTVTLTTPTKTGNTFTGYTITTNTSGSASSISSRTTLNIPADAYGAVTVKANWSVNSYSITYKDKGNVDFSGSHGAGYPTSYTYGTGATLDAPTKIGYKFGGYYANSACTGDPVTSIGASETGAKTLYAKWVEYQDFWVSFGGGAKQALTSVTPGESEGVLYQLSTTSTLTVWGGESITFFRGASAGEATPFTYANGLVAEGGENNVVTTDNTWKVHNYASGINIYFKVLNSGSFQFYLNGHHTNSDTTHGVYSGTTLYIQDFLKANGCDFNFATDNTKIAVFFDKPVGEADNLTAWSVAFATKTKSEDNVDLYTIEVPQYAGHNMTWGGVEVLRYGSDMTIKNLPEHGFEWCYKDNDSTFRKHGVKVTFGSDVENAVRINTHDANTDFGGGYSCSGNTFMYTDGGLASGKGVYIDVSTAPWGEWRLTGGYGIFVYFFSVVDGSDSANAWSEMATLVPGEDYLYECEVPQCSGEDVEWAKIVVVNNNEKAFVQDANQYQTQDLWYNSLMRSNQRIYFTGNRTSEYKAEASTSSSYTDATRAESWGTRFIGTNVKCSGGDDPSISTDNWTAARNEYNAAPKAVRTIITESEAAASDTAPGATNLQLAVRRYDYIIGKYGTSAHPDFASRSGTTNYSYVPPASAFVPGASKGNDSPLTTTLWIVLASGLAGLAAIGTAYFVSKKKRHQA